METLKYQFLEQAIISVFGAQRLLRQRCFFFLSLAIFTLAVHLDKGSVEGGAWYAGAWGSVQRRGSYRSDMTVDRKWRSKVNLAWRNKQKSAEKETYVQVINIIQIISRSPDVDKILLVHFYHNLSLLSKFVLFSNFSFKTLFYSKFYQILLFIISLMTKIY